PAGSEIHDRRRFPFVFSCARVRWATVVSIRLSSNHLRKLMRSCWTAMLPSTAPRGAVDRPRFVCENKPMADFDPSTDVILAEIAAAQSPEALEELRVRVLGRRGSLTLAMRELGGLEPEE